MSIESGESLPQTEPLTLEEVRSELHLRTDQIQDLIDLYVQEADPMPDENQVESWIQIVQRLQSEIDTLTPENREQVERAVRAGIDLYTQELSRRIQGKER